MERQVFSAIGGHRQSFGNLNEWLWIRFLVLCLPLHWCWGAAGRVRGGRRRLRWRRKTGITTLRPPSTARRIFRFLLKRVIRSYHEFGQIRRASCVVAPGRNWARLISTSAAGRACSFSAIRCCLSLKRINSRFRLQQIEPAKSSGTVFLQDIAKSAISRRPAFR